MKRITVIALTTATNLVAIIGAAFVFYTPTPDLYGEGVMLLRAKQAQECKEGGGCAIISKREMSMVEAFIRANANRGNQRGEFGL
jgi:hypothetical protein